MPIIKYSPNSNNCGGSSSKPGPIVLPTVYVELHVCMGLNACKGHDRNGNNNCAGTGYCATAQAHVCHTLNNCHGQGGCGLYGDKNEQAKPGHNECAWQGSCAVPIQAERFNTIGPDKGKSVWLLARKLFEERMVKAKRNVGNAPFLNGPPQQWLINNVNGFSSCGNSGDIVCSFGFSPASEHAKKL